MLTTEGKAEITAEARLHAVRAAVVGGARFKREIQKLTGLPENQVDRALQKLRKTEKFTYGGKTGWEPPRGKP